MKANVNSSIRGVGTKAGGGGRVARGRRSRRTPGRTGAGVTPAPPHAAGPCVAPPPTALAVTAPRYPPPRNAPAPLTRVDALRRQQPRILHRSALIEYVLTAETRASASMGDALAELLD